MDAVLDPLPYVAGLAAPSFGRWRGLAPWQLTAQAPALVRELLAGLRPRDWQIDDEVAVHRSARIEAGAVLKGPLIVGAHGFIAAGAYLRGGNWLDDSCTLGPGVELKSSLVFSGAALAHFNFVGDSIIGAGANFEAGSIVCNHRNERDDRQIRVRIDGRLLATGADKFGALVGDGVRVGANAVLAPGCLLAPGVVVPRGAVVDQEAG